MTRQDVINAQGVLFELRDMLDNLEPEDIEHINYVFGLFEKVLTI